MQQETLFFERLEDALAAVVDRCGGRKKVASEMFPDKPMRDAHNLLDAMLNPDCREKFAPAQVVYLAKRGRAVGCHAIMLYLAREAGYSDPQPLAPEEREAELQRKFIEAVGALEGIKRELTQAREMRRVA